jgi:sugar lactone lactonase YvrE
LRRDGCSRLERERHALTGAAGGGGGRTLEVVVDDIGWGEGLRWHDGHLWLSDLARGRVLRVRPGEEAEVVAHDIPGASGLAFTADGDVLVASLHGNAVHRLPRAAAGAAVPVGPVLFADLAPLGGRSTNELATVRSCSYVSHMGRAYETGDEFRDYPDGDVGGIFALDHRTGRARTVATGLALPNGMAVTSDGRRLVVAEMYRRRLLVFERGDDDELGDHRVLAELDGQPDGIALDEAGGVWAGLANRCQFVRVDPSGAVTDRIELAETTVACALGDDDGHTLFLAVATYDSTEDLLAGRSRGRILATRVDVGAAAPPPA